MPFALAFIAAICLLAWVLPAQVMQALIAGVWVLMALAAVLLPVLSLLGAI